MIYVNCPLSLRNVEDLLFERGLDICHATVRLWWTRFDPERVRRMETLQKTISIRNAISSAEIATESAAQPPWRSGERSLDISRPVELTRTWTVTS